MRSKMLRKVMAIALAAGMLFSDPVNAASSSPWEVYDEDGEITENEYDHRDEDTAFCDTVVLVDLSSNNGDVDFEAISEAGVDGVMLRCASSATAAKDSSVSVDKNFETYYEAARDAGLRVGVYLFSQALSVKEANKQADYVLKLIDDKDIDLPVAFDYEMQKRLKTAKLDKDAKTAIAEAFCVSIKRGGYTPLFYSNSKFMIEEINADKLAKNFGIWVARYNDIVYEDTDKGNMYSGPVTMWQFTDSGVINGISEKVDVNFYYEPKDANVPKVSGVKLKPGTRSIKVSWNAVENVSGYQVYRSSKKNSGFVKIKSTGSVYYRNTALRAGERFYYKVRAYRVIHGREIYGNWSVIKSGKAK